MVKLRHFKKSILLIFLFLLVVGIGLWASQITFRHAHSQIKIAPTKVHQALTQVGDWLNVSRPLRPEDLQGRMILVDFWTYCCINCLQTFPDLKALEKEFGKDLTVLGVHSAKFDNEKEQENIRAAVLRYGLEHPVVNDRDFKIWESFGVRAWPTLVLINPEGKVEASLSGEGHLQSLREKIEKLKSQYAGQYNSAPLPLKPESISTAKSSLRFPGKMAYAPEKNWLFISDSGHHRILVSDLKGKVLYEIGKKDSAGSQDGGFSEARLRGPQGLLYFNKKLYVADTENHLLREVDFSSQQVKTLAGTGRRGRVLLEKNQPALKTGLSSPWDLARYGDSGDIAMAMAGTHQLWTYSPSKQTVSVLAGNGRESIEDGAFPYNSLSQPSGLAYYQDRLYVVDSETSSLRVLKEGKLKTLIGTGLFDFGFKDGKQGEAKMQHPLGVWADDSGVYIADAYNHSIRHYDLKTKILKTYLGDGKRSDNVLSHRIDSTTVRLNEPNDIIKIGESFLVVDTNNHQIRFIDPVTHQVKALALDFGEKSTGPRQVDLNRRLPNLKVKHNLPIPAETPLGFSLKYPEGYHINEEAPSWLEIVEVSDKQGRVLHRFSKEKLQQEKISLSPLLKNKDYRLQGTLYYCRSDNTGSCLLESRDQALVFSQKAPPQLVLEVGMGE